MPPILLHIILSLILLSSTSLLAQEDTNQLAIQKYPINDPRNPDCPCHKYQALADKEYALLTTTPKPEIKKNIQKKVELQSFIPQQPQLIQPSDSVHLPEILPPPINSIKETSLSESSTSNRHRKNNNIVNKLKFRIFRVQKNFRSKRNTIDIDKCFHWHR